jgi:hypothetical protein
LFANQSTPCPSLFFQFRISLDFQSKYFDGWPEENLPIKYLNDEWRDAVRNKCTDPVYGTKLVMPNFSQVPGGEPTTACPSANEGKLSDNVNVDTDADEDADASDDEDDDEEGGKMWELTKIYTDKELNDHSKLSNEGNGLLPKVRNDLLCELQKSKAELDQLGWQLKSTTAAAFQLESEPKNEALIVELANLEKTLGEMNDKVQELKSHAVSKSPAHSYLVVCSLISNHH